MNAKKTAAGGDPLAVLRVWDRLEVGPVVLERNRLRAPYRVRIGKQVEETELTYRFEEDVFAPGEPESENLAAMLAAQVALNYGLFCGEIVLHGPHDRHDRRFLLEMARNTAREIYVKKFLEPNPFLVGDAAKLPAVKRDSYLRAQLVFPDPEPETPKRPGPGWDLGAGRHAVLSSGGKDSLLSFGILRELGIETHPVFVNESGRHWFTALNAYRHFRETVPTTGRVWTDADRLFAWMLRHLPFVRQDFASIRSDEYPIRLWTVAVFLFGALPVLRRRGIGRLLIGDEFDTSDRRQHEGITHYNGLFDQSRWFDSALTRYFHRKGWNVSQFSILRPLSELLILEILARRYPDLQAHQVSCHAAHKEGERIRPCGRCEKCRRIVGMMTALDVDPGHCGYTRDQIDRCLKDLVAGGVHQEDESAEHLAHLLKKRGIIAGDQLGKARARPHPEVVSLRFDRERSTLETTPTDLREPVWRIFLEHAEGALWRSGRVWLEYDLFEDPEIKRPYPFERKGQRTAADGGAGEGTSPYLLAEMTWPVAKRRFAEVDVAILPVGAVEQHGPHLPLDVDAFDADWLAREVARRCSDPRPLVLPPIHYGVSYHHDEFPGTLSVSPDTLTRLVYEIGLAAARNGITKLVIINGHGGNGPALHFAAQNINRDAHILTCVDTGETSDVDVEALAETQNDVHAGEIETSTTLANRPQLVEMDKATPFVPEFSIRYLNFSSRRSVGWYAHTHKISPDGVMGDPTKASADKGRRMWDVMIERLVEFVEDLKAISLEEIHQRRY
jgi:creatinine amidohydrolase/Fe(II)-dependent formamide hydrolase-like protein